MNSFFDIESQLAALGFGTGVLRRYEEVHRFYHTTDHLLDVINTLGDVGSLDKELFLAAVYHDAIYNPKSNDNEEQSAALFNAEAAETALASEEVGSVTQLILDTQSHRASSPKAQQLMDADLDILKRPLKDLLVWEQQIFKEYQFADYRLYQPKRIEVLNSLNANGRLDPLIEYVKARKPRIGLFCGSLNPFHKGHFNILQKAEKIFDKVIIAFGVNPDKEQRTWEIPNALQYRQIEHYPGLLTDFIASLEQDVVVIRGLRNSTDFQYEQNQYRYLQELMPGIRIIAIFCDKEFEHISSSGIRTLEKYGQHGKYLLD